MTVLLKLLPATLAATSLLPWAPPCIAQSPQSPSLPAESSTLEESPPATMALAADTRRERGDAATLREVRRISRKRRLGLHSRRAAAGPAVRGPRDTWEQIRLLMTIVPASPDISFLRQFQRKLRRYHGNQAFFDHLGEKAYPWLYYVTRLLAERGMPGELALLPAVESGYDAAAVSPREAAGLWQLHPDTARELKLARSRWYDGRHDPVAATPAALDYLTFLRDTFNGDWMLAVAAYNCGPGNVRQAIRRAGLRLEVASYPAIERHLPLETRGHMARWLVLSELVAVPRLHNIRLKPVPARPYFAEMPAESLTQLSAAARQAGVPPAEISRLNPGFRRGVTAPGVPHRLLVPAEHAGRLTRELAQLRLPVNTQPWRHRVREGDTLSSIARAHGTTVATIIAVNGLSSHFIRIGRELTIPVPGDPSSPTGRSVKRLNAVTHVVTPGESLWRIARRYRTTVDSLRGWNRLAPGSSLLRPGQKLHIQREG